MPLSFFFQAEAGIRDFHVTGVQTCALPICSVALEGENSPDLSEYRHGVHVKNSLLEVQLLFIDGASWGSSLQHGSDPERGNELRSEERRVGKECRSRYWETRYTEVD